jgi:hypothetical protein
LTVWWQTIESLRHLLSTELSDKRERGGVDTMSFFVLWRIDPLLGKDIETKNEYSRCYAIGEKTNGRC